MNQLKRRDKFQLDRKKIKALESSSQRFHRVYSEYKSLSEDLWHINNASSNNLPDDFHSAVEIQTHYLEQEINEWLNRASM